MTREEAHKTVEVNVVNVPPYDLTVPADKVEEIKLSKPSGKIFY